MSEKHSIASKNRWKKIPAKERSKIMKQRAEERWGPMSVKDRKKIGRKLVEARQLKK